MSIKLSILVKFGVVGYHQWKEAPMEVDYLKPRHRHMFVIRAKIPVTDDDRQLEFFTVQKFLREELEAMYPGFEFGGYSCEMLANIILRVIQNKYGIKKDITVSVHEDDENGGSAEC